MLGFDSLLDCLDEILTVPAVSEVRLGGVNGNKTIASYEDALWKGFVEEFVN